MHLFAYGAREPGRYAPAGLLASLWFWPGEPPVPARGTSEPSLPSFQLACLAFLHLVYFLKRVFFAVRAVALDFPRNLHRNHSSIVTVSKEGI